MKIIKEDGKLCYFDAWSGAKETKEAIINAGKEDEFEELIEELYPDGLSETTLNDLLRFYSESVFEVLGIQGEE